MIVSTTTKADHESATSAELIPEFLRSSANNFVDLLEEYYKYMNQEGLGPTRILQTVPEQHSLTDIDDRYLSALKLEFANYVPDSFILEPRDLYEKIVKYFYNTRGSVESIKTFFKVFYGVNAVVNEDPNRNISGDPGNRVTSENDDRVTSDLNNRTTIQESDAYAWKPFEYTIRTELDISVWESSYRELVHPAGFRFYALILFVTIIENSWFNHGSSYFNYLSPRLSDWLVEAKGGQHSPESQPGWLTAITRILVDSLVDSNIIENPSHVALITQLLAAFILYDPFGFQHYTKVDWLLLHKFGDESIIGSLETFTIENMEAPYSGSILDGRYAGSNVSSFVNITTVV
jgi:hypothetical protein